jgi:hypothetical protein
VHRDLVFQRYEANLGRPLTTAERQEIEAYLSQPSGLVESLSPWRGLQPNPRMQPTGRRGAGRRSGGALRERR